MTLHTLSELMQFPVAVPNDGMVDLVIQGRVSSRLFCHYVG